MARKRPAPINNLIVVSDLHCGCRVGLCPPKGVRLDDGGRYMPSTFQLDVWALWRAFWDTWVPVVTHGEPYAVIVNGDVIDGVHHNSVTQVSQNIEDQIAIARAVLAPVVSRSAAYYHVRGTEAHVGKSAQYEEQVARELNATPNSEGQYARWELWKEAGRCLVHFSHHVGTTGSSAYESTAVYKELVELYVEAGRWGRRPPDVVVRSHRHRFFQTAITGARGKAMSVVTPGWQGKTPFAYKIPGARHSQPQFGGIIIRQGDEEFYVREKVWSLEPPPIE